jgi:hypothetical protein
MAAIVLTATVSHVLIAALNVVLFMNKLLMSVIKVVMMLVHGTGSVCPGGLNGVLVPSAYPEIAFFML